MRGSKSLSDRGIIPRLLSAIYRRGRKIEKDSTEGATKIDIVMSYYEIYNDKVYDLFEPPEKRTLAGLPLRDSNGKTIVVGLTERPCTSLKDFEYLYDQANMNRSTSATKLNAHSSRSHAILCVKIAFTVDGQTRFNTVSAIDLAGSEDNRRTENGKERMVESASINKSLFVLAQCVEAISKKSQRIPYRESKMTRILSLGQNNGLTLMILNLAPVRSHHLDTLSSLNFANRTKKIEMREVENDPILRGPNKPIIRSSVTGSLRRQPLRPLTSSINTNLAVMPLGGSTKACENKPVKAFYVYSDKMQPKANITTKIEASKRTSPLKRSPGTTSRLKCIRYKKTASPIQARRREISAARIEEMVEKKVGEILAARALNEASKRQPQAEEINEKVQQRLELLEKRIKGTEEARAKGLSYILMAKQHQAGGEECSALKMYELALPFFPDNKKLMRRIVSLKEKLGIQQESAVWGNLASTARDDYVPSTGKRHEIERHRHKHTESDEDYEEPETSNDEEDAIVTKSRQMTTRTSQGRSASSLCQTNTANNPTMLDASLDEQGHSPRTTKLLSVINSREIGQIKLLKGVGIKKAEAIVDCLCEMDHLLEREVEGYTANPAKARVQSLVELGRMKGIGLKTVQNMRNGVV
ncbi:P-loop containing nucleoside triphosphate hydrolase protein [Elaphomyces granulatus]